MAGAYPELVEQKTGTALKTVPVLGSLFTFYGVQPCMPVYTSLQENSRNEEMQDNEDSSNNYCFHAN
jgi:hypothetical protein